MNSIEDSIRERLGKIEAERGVRVLFAYIQQYDLLHGRPLAEAENALLGMSSTESLCRSFPPGG